MSSGRNPLLWASLHSHSDMSLLDGLSKPEQLIERSVKNGIPAIALTDHGTMAGIIKWQKAKKKVIDKFSGTENEDAAKSIKLINGCEMYIKDDDKVNSHLVVLAKNKDGYKTLIKMVSEATRRENFYRKPRLSIGQISDFNKDKNLISFSGHSGSDLGNYIFADLQGAYSSQSESEVRQFIHPQCKKRLLEKADEYIQAFGRDNFFLEKQLFDAKRLPAQLVIAKAMDWLAKETGLRIVATADSHYVLREHAEDQRILLCNALKTTLPKVYRQIASDDNDVALGGFFLSDKYYLPTAREMSELHSEDEIKCSLEIAEAIESYDLSSPPVIPTFDCPGGLSSDEYMKELCRKGWKEKLHFTNKEQRKEYGDRINYELDILQGAKLSDYFLIVQDLLNYIKSQGYLTGPGRGSAAGCLTSYLLGITAVDPIPPGLIFERFYNAGRNTPGKPASLPDIDCDIQGAAADIAVKYLKSKYERENVGQIANYGRLMGRACLKDVLRAHEACDFQTMNKICSFLVDESAIADELQEMKEEEGESSIIKWALENNQKELAEWAWWNEKENKVEGPFAKYFEQAIRLEGTYRQRGKHAAGYVIYPGPVTDICPVTYNKDGEVEIDFDMHDVDYTGGAKIDILKVWVLDKVADCAASIRNQFLLEE